MQKNARFRRLQEQYQHCKQDNYVNLPAIFKKKNMWYYRLTPEAEVKKLRRLNCADKGVGKSGVIKKCKRV